jgi:hypothetical protein
MNFHPGTVRAEQVEALFFSLSHSEQQGVEALDRLRPNGWGW